MPKRRYSECDTAEPGRRQQLYLIFDDWSSGYSIREVNLPSRPSHLSAVSGEVAEQRLPPPFFHFAVPRGLPQYFASAFGTRIIATHPKDPKFEGAYDDFIPILDVHERNLILGPAQSFYPLHPIYLPVGDKMLFSLHSGYMEVLWRSLREQPSVDDKHMDWSWCNLPDPPFRSIDVTSYAVHPTGPSILFGTESIDDTSATFSFHTEELVWKQLGEWSLPFTSRAHCINSLEIFVGLSKDPETLGHLCFCDIDSLNTSGTQCPAPAWKLCQEKLFSDKPGEEHVSATLVHMGSKSKFCLVECILFSDERSEQVLEEGDLKRRGACHMYRLMKFSLKFDRKGDLKLKGRRVRYFKVPKRTSIECICNAPSAFFL